MSQPRVLSLPCSNSETAPRGHPNFTYWLNDDNEGPWTGHLDTLRTQEPRTNIGRDIESIASDFYDDVVMKDDSCDGSRDEHDIDEMWGMSDEIPQTLHDAGPSELEDVENARTMEGGGGHLISDEDWNSPFIGGESETNMLEEGEVDEEEADLNELSDGSTCVAFIPSTAEPHTDLSVMTGSNTFSTMIDIDHMWTRRDDEEIVEDLADLSAGFPTQNLEDIAFSTGSEIQLPPSIFEQASIIARQNINHAPYTEDEYETWSEPLDEAEEERLDVFYECLANYGPWFGVTKRLSQEDMFRISTPEAEKTST